MSSNHQTIIDLLSDGRSRSEAEIASETGIKQATVANSLRQLYHAGYLDRRDDLGAAYLWYRQAERTDPREREGEIAPAHSEILDWIKLQGGTATYAALTAEFGKGKVRGSALSWLTMAGLLERVEIEGERAYRYPWEVAPPAPTPTPVPVTSAEVKAAVEVIEPGRDIVRAGTIDDEIRQVEQEIAHLKAKLDAEQAALAQKKTAKLAKLREERDQLKQRLNSLGSAPS